MKRNLFGVVIGLSALLLAFNAGATGSSNKSSSNQPGSAGSQSSASSAQGAAAQPSQLDNEMVLNELHHINQKEIQLAQLAQDKAQSQEVKNTAQKLLSDHQALESRVEQVAKAQNIKLEKFQPATYEKANMDKMKELSGAQFDQAFMHDVMRDHRMAIEQLKMARNEVQDTQIRSLLDQAIPRIRQHEMAAKSGQHMGSMGGISGSQNQPSSSSSSSGSSMDQSSQNQPSASGSSVNQGGTTGSDTSSNGSVSGSTSGGNQPSASGSSSGSNAGGASGGGTSGSTSSSGG